MKLYSRVCKLMGSAFELQVCADSADMGHEMILLGIAEIERIESLLSEFLPTSLTSRVNQNAGKQPVQADKEFCDLLNRCIKISNITAGYFDITAAVFKKIYQFKNAEAELPSNELVRSTLQKTGFGHIKVNTQAQTVYLAQPGAHINFAAIGKGYAADCVKKLWQAHNVPGGCINASGDLTVFGKRPDGEDWQVAIANPDNRGEILFRLPLCNSSVATSGDYEKFFLHNGVRYSHNINPKTGRPLTGVKSVTVFSPSAELSDALATAVYAMGPQQGIAFVNTLPHTHAIVIDESNAVFFSQKLNYEAYA